MSAPSPVPPFSSVNPQIDHMVAADDGRDDGRGHGVEEVDVAILGAGCAGLSLAARLAKGDGDLRVVVIDPRTKFADDRSWSFWNHDHHALRDVVAHEWSGWTFSDTRGRQVTHRVEGMSYQYIRGADFYQWALAAIATDPRVDLRLGLGAHDLGEVILSDGTAGVEVQTDRGPLRARRVVDTRPRRTRALLYQCFSGVEIEHGGTLASPESSAGLGAGAEAGAGADAAAETTPDAVGLMTRMRSGADGLAFVYVLPLSPTRALVEWTRFSPVPVAQSVVAAERDAELMAMGLSEATVVREEGGILPMGRVDAPQPAIAGVVLAGITGGALRDASGYAFLRIQLWAAACADSLARGEAPAPHPVEPWVRRQMDRIFLQAVRAHPERTAEYFMAMATGAAPKRLLRFLTDRATVGDLIGIIASLPLRPFLAQLPDRRARFVAAAAASETRLDQVQK
jgi:lycopene beta-cyclase